MSLFDVKKLTEDRAKLVHDCNRMTELVGTEQRAFTQEETQTFDRMFNDAQEMLTKIETANRLAKAQAMTSPQEQSKDLVRTGYQPAPRSKRDGENAFKAWALTASGNSHLVSEHQRSVAQQLGVNVASVSFQARLSQLDTQYYSRAQTVGTTTEGGYLRPSDAFAGLDLALKWYGGLRQFARVIRTANGNPIHFATESDVDNVAEVHTENNAVNNTNLTFGTVALSSYTYDSGVFPVSLELIQDAELSVSQLVSDALATRIGRKQNTAGTLGTGVTAGLVPSLGGSAAVTGASATTVSYNELVNLYFSVDKAYRNLPSCAWMMNDATLAALVKVTDSVGRPLWGNGLNGTPGDSLLGKPVVINNDVASMASAAKSILFGAGEKFLIRDVADVIVRVLNERYADSLAVGFIAFARFDTNCVNASAIKYFKNATSGT